MSIESGALSGAFLKLASAVGREHDSWHDGERWEVFDLAIQQSFPLADIFAALEGESDVGVVSAVVVRIIETVPGIDVAGWTALLPEGRVKQFAEARAADVQILREVLAAASWEARPEVEEWSEWLQRRVAEHSTNAEILDQLTLRGRTRRIRDTARQRASTVHRT